MRNDAENGRRRGWREVSARTAAVALAGGAVILAGLALDAEPGWARWADDPLAVERSEVTLDPARVPQANPAAAGRHEWVTVEAGWHDLGGKTSRHNPPHRVFVPAFQIATTETTNAQFALFVAATGYVTDAERTGRGQVFVDGSEDWEWHADATADWRRPDGAAAARQADFLRHPVTQVSFADALAYCEWAGLRLPTQDEWEVAARAGSAARYPWGDELAPGGHWAANIWQGPTHRHNDLLDGFARTAPIGSFPPNARGLYDVIGNVFEYVAPNPPPDGKAVKTRTMALGRGGSWWCSAGTCSYFNLEDVGRMHAHFSLSNQGFRVAR